MIGSDADRLEGAPADQILRWAADRYAPRIAFATAFGAEGCVVVDLIARHALPIAIVTVDTGLLFDETYAVWNELERRYGVRIDSVRPDQTVAEQAAAHGDALWRRDPDRCCALRKVAPMRRALAGLDAWVTAIRRDQTPERADARVVESDGTFGIVKVNPLVSWTAPDVWCYIAEHDVPYNRLHDRQYPTIGCWPCTTPVGPGEDPRAGRWRGHRRTECGLHGLAGSPGSSVGSLGNSVE